MPRPSKVSSSPDSTDSIALSRERIVEVALALISEKGLDGFSLRDVARSLGVYPTAIYWHIKSKNELLADVSTLTMSRVIPPRGRAPWQDRLRSLFRRYRKTMQQHPNLAQLVGARLLSNSEGSIELVEFILQALVEAECPEPNIVALYNTVVASMCGFVTLELAPMPTEEAAQWSAQLEKRVHHISALRYPTLSKHLVALANNSFILRWEDGYRRPLESGFEAYVDVFIAGLENRIAALRLPA